MDEQTETSCEPMDIDLSAHSTSAMDISYIDRSLNSSPIIKKEEEDFDRNSIDKSYAEITPLSALELLADAKKSNKSSKASFRRPIISVIIIILSIIIYSLTQFKCMENINYNMVRDTLQTKLYGQSNAIELLVEALEADYSTKIIFIYGGTGVGKTYTASLLLENLLQFCNVYHYTMPSFLQISTEYLFGLSICESSIVVVDDLNINDITNIRELIRSLVMKSENLSKRITILLLYNCNTMDKQYVTNCDKDFVKNINQTYYNMKMKYFIKYESLSEKHLKLCIVNEIPNRILSETEMLKLMRYFNVQDGCKGVYQKMKYLNVI